METQRYGGPKVSRQFQLCSRQFQVHHGNFNFIVGYYPDGNGPLESRQVFPVLRQVENNCRDTIEIAVAKLKLLWLKLKLPWWNWNCREPSWIAVMKLKLPWHFWATVKRRVKKIKNKKITVNQSLFFCSFTKQLLCTSPIFSIPSEKKNLQKQNKETVLKDCLRKIPQIFDWLVPCDSWTKGDHWIFSYWLVWYTPHASCHSYWKTKSD